VRERKSTFSMDHIPSMEKRLLILFCEISIGPNQLKS